MHWVVCRLRAQLVSDRRLALVGRILPRTQPFERNGLRISTQYPFRISSYRNFKPLFSGLFCVFINKSFPNRKRIATPALQAPVLRGPRALHVLCRVAKYGTDVEHAATCLGTSVPYESELPLILRPTGLLPLLLLIPDLFS